jgi:hypothetical protein
MNEPFEPPYGALVSVGFGAAHAGEELFSVAPIEPISPVSPYPLRRYRNSTGCEEGGKRMHLQAIRDALRSAALWPVRGGRVIMAID